MNIYSYLSPEEIAEVMINIELEDVTALFIEMILAMLQWYFRKCLQMMQWMC